MKRWLSMLLAVCMVWAMLIPAAWAEEIPAEAEEAAETFFVESAAMEDTEVMEAEEAEEMEAEDVEVTEAADVEVMEAAEAEVMEAEEVEVTEAAEAADVEVTEAADAEDAEEREAPANLEAEEAEAALFASATENVYAILYSNGTLVFQNGNTPQSGRAVTAAYPVDLADGYTFDTTNWEPTTPWYGARESITAVDFADTIAPQSTALWFYDCQKLAAITNLANLDTSHVTNMRYMFYNCYKLTELDVSGFDTSHVTNMSNMFVYCMWLTALDVSGFDTSNVTDMSYMFSDCNRLAALDVSGFDTSHVTNMMYMFAYCGELATLDLSGFDTSHVTSMSQMFYACDGLAELNLSAFDTSNVKYMLQMFAYCDVLTTIRVSERFVTSQVTEGRYMFSGSTALVGGSGTRYSEDHQDVKYARIDSAAAPGYFTYAAAPITPTPTPYPAPKLIGATASTASITVKWNAVSGVSRYRVYRKTASTGWKTLANTTTTSYTDKKATAGTTYTYTVRCLSADGKTAISSYNTKGVSAKITPAPALIGAMANNTVVIALWDAVPGVAKYRVYRKTASTGWKTLADTSDTFYIDTSAKKGTAYYYTVRCMSADGKTAISSYNATGVSATRK